MTLNEKLAEAKTLAEKTRPHPVIAKQSPTTDTLPIPSPGFLFPSWQSRYHHNQASNILSKTAIAVTQATHNITVQTSVKRAHLESDMLELLHREEVRKDHVNHALTPIALERKMDVATHLQAQLLDAQANIDVAKAAKIADIEVQKTARMKAIELAVQTSEAKLEMAAAILKQHWEELSLKEKMEVVRQLDEQRILQIPDGE